MEDGKFVYFKTHAIMDQSKSVSEVCIGHETLEDAQECLDAMKRSGVLGEVLADYARKGIRCDVRICRVEIHKCEGEDYGQDNHAAVKNSRN